MRRNGFTMVELIFVIIIIGILSVAAIPKFGDIKDRAKINTEYSSLSGLDGAIIAAMEFHAEDNDGDIDVLWHGQSSGTLNTEYETTDTGINQQGAVLSKVVNKGDKLKIVAYSSLNSAGVTGADTDMVYDVIFIEGEASNSTSGVKKDTDVPGKPDKNDVWVFNSSPIDIVVESGATPDSKTVESGELVLIDIAGTDTVTYVSDGANAAGEIGITNSASIDLAVALAN